MLCGHKQKGLGGVSKLLEEQHQRAQHCPVTSALIIFSVLAIVVTVGLEPLGLGTVVRSSGVVCCASAPARLILCAREEGSGAGRTVVGEHGAKLDQSKPTLSGCQLGVSQGPLGY